jgi:hypothetical protein
MALAASIITESLVRTTLPAFGMGPGEKEGLAAIIAAA